MEDLFRQFWWLIFPVLGMVYGLVSMLQAGRNQARAFDLMRTYVEQGKEPPPELMKALSQPGVLTEESRGSSISGAWWTFFIFLALTAGFAVGIGGFDSEASTAFLVVTVVMSVLACGSFLLALYATFRKRQ